MEVFILPCFSAQEAAGDVQFGINQMKSVCVSCLAENKHVVGLEKIARESRGGCI